MSNRDTSTQAPNQYLPLGQATPRGVYVNTTQFGEFPDMYMTSPLNHNLAHPHPDNVDWDNHDDLFDAFDHRKLTKKHMNNDKGYTQHATGFPHENRGQLIGRSKTSSRRRGKQTSGRELRPLIYAIITPDPSAEHLMMGSDKDGNLSGQAFWFLKIGDGNFRPAYATHNPAFQGSPNVNLKLEQGKMSIKDVFQHLKHYKLAPLNNSTRMAIVNQKRRIGKAVEWSCLKLRAEPDTVSRSEWYKVTPQLESAGEFRTKLRRFLATFNEAKLPEIVTGLEELLKNCKIEGRNRSCHSADQVFPDPLGLVNNSSLATQGGVQLDFDSAQADQEAVDYLPFDSEEYQWRHEDLLDEMNAQEHRLFEFHESDLQEEAPLALGSNVKIAPANF